MNVEKIVTKTETKKLDFTKITILSVEECRSLKDKIPTTKEVGWWLRSPGINDYSAALAIGGGGFVDAEGITVNSVFGVRPALCISNLESLQVGDKFELAKHSWTIISDKYALCDNIIGRSVFQKDDNKKRLNDYETSGVKRYIENWAKENGIEFVQTKELDEKEPEGEEIE